MYGDLDKLEEMKEKLNSVSPSFCLAKWMHSTIHLGTGKTHSCYLPQTHKIPLNEVKKNVDALHNTSHKKEMRKKMIDGERPSECQICWSIEDLPGDHLSDRLYRSVDSWNMPYFDKVAKQDPKKSVNPSYLEVSFSNACNLMCSYCSPAASSSWMKEIKTKGTYKLESMEYQHLDYFKQTGEIPLEEEKNPYIKAFWNWWPDLVKDLMYFRITGGEPLLSPQTFKVLDYLNNNPQPHLRISINSNFSIEDKFFNKFLVSLEGLLENKKIHEHIAHVSLDTYGEQAEYIRDGLNFERLNKNIETYLEKIPLGSLAIMCTFNNLSIDNFKHFLEWILSLRKRYQNQHRQIFLDIPHLQFPTHQSVQMLPEAYQEKVSELIGFMKERNDKTIGFRKAEVLKLERILEWMRNSPSDNERKKHRADFYKFFSEKDRRRNTSFEKTFPHMTGFWNLCKDCSTS